MASYGRASFVTSVVAIVGLVACSDLPDRPTSSKSTLSTSLDGGLFTCPLPVGDQFQRFPWRQSKPLHGRACTDAQSNFIIQCYLNDQARTPQCQSFVNDPQNAPCIMCAVSKPDDPALGPLIYSEKSGAAAFNLAGCVAGLTNDANGSGCGGLYALASQCVSASCECASDPYFAQCLQASRQTTCAKYFSAASCASQAIPACEGSGQTFWIGPGALTRAFELVKLFCGP
jgi:hypothetical protein